MRRAGAAVALSLVAVLLSGCVGIPASGDVVAGPPIDEDEDTDFVSIAQGPLPGAEQEEILEGFLQAANSPQSDYEIAKQYLTDDLRETWEPDDSVAIRSGADPVTRVAENSLEYAFTAIAGVNADGQYREESSGQSRRFVFAQEDGEWRISEAMDGIVLSQNSFDIVFDEHALYFFDPTYEYLVPDVRWFPRRLTISSRVVRALLAGPSTWLQGAVVNEFPEATQLGPAGVTPVSGRATVDLTEEASAASGATRERMRQQLEATLAPSGVSTVILTVDGLPLTIPAPNAVDAVSNPAVGSAPLVIQDGELGFAGGEGITDVPGLSEKILTLGPAAVTLSSDHASAAVLAEDGTVYLARTGNGPALAVDTRPGLVAPAMDTLDFLWSAPGEGGITAYDFGGTEHPLNTASLPAGATITSIDISRDGTRLLLYLQADAGSGLAVVGIVRQEDHVPVRLGEPYYLPVDPAAVPVDAAWIDNRTVATLSRLGEETLAHTFAIGGASAALGEAEGAVTISGVNRGVDGIRVLADGVILRPRGNGGWQSTGLSATLLGTQQ